MRMYKSWLVVALLILLGVVANVYSAHFRGAVIMVKPKPGGAAKEMEISYQISWRRSAGNGYGCTSTNVTNRHLYNGGSKINCQYGCSGNIISRISYVCTYFSVEDDWSFGEYGKTYTFSSVYDENTVTIGTVSSDWIREVGESSWNVSTTFSLVTRADTGKINSSPQVVPIPPLYLQQGCSYTIPLAVSDPDNDTVKCRWAVGRECSSICNKFPGAVLDSASCNIHYTANNGSGIKAVAVMIEDYAPRSPHHPLSSVALQFLVSVYYSNQPCHTQVGYSSIILHPSNVILYLNKKHNNLTLKCVAKEPSGYYWERQNGKIPSSAIGVHTNTLTLINVQPKDAGNYRCVALSCLINCSRSFSNYAAVIVNIAPSTIVTQPTDTSAAAPFSAVFTCDVEGYGYQNITWHRHSGTLHHKYMTSQMNSHGVVTSTLIISNVTEEDVGQYYCRVSANDIYVESKRAELYYSGTPAKPSIRVYSHQLIKLSVNNYKLKIVCLPHDRAFTYSYKWERKNRQLPLNAQYTSRGKLIIIGLKPEDSGEYRCIISNSTGQIASDYSLVAVKVALPTIMQQPSSTVTEVYNVATFECTARSYGNVSITWRRLNSELPETANITMSKSLNDITSVLRIEKSIGYYKGYYYCVIGNKAGIVNSRMAYCSVTVPCPQMIIPPKPVVVRPNAAVTFSCLAWSYGGLSYKWNRNDNSTLPSTATMFFQNKPFPADANCLTMIYELNILNIQTIDEGSYCCIASNECGNNIECAWLEVDTSPVINMQPKSQTFKDQEKNILTLWIAAYGIGPIYYQWQKYDTFSNTWVSPSSRAENISSPNLTFNLITEEDQGLYHCIASNDDGSVVSDNASITVYSSPSITYYSSRIVAFEGDKVNLVCNATNDGDAIDPVQISWYNGTKLLKSDGKNVTVYSKYNSVTDQIQSILVLDSVNNTDDGEYICRAFNHPFCYREEKINLTVEYAPRITIDPPQSPHMVNEGERLLLYCIAEGFPIPTIQWYKNHALIPQQSSQVYLASTDIPSTTVYTCEGKNNAGNIQNIARTSITVIVKKIEKCPTLSDPTNGKVFIVGKAAIFTCNSGFVTIGNSYLRCINGVWSSPPPKCQTS